MRAAVLVGLLAACGGDAARTTPDALTPDTTAPDALASDTTEAATAPDTTEPDTTEADASAPDVFGGSRPAGLVVPAGYDGTTALPAIVLLGGYDYLARDLDDWIALSDRVDARGFFLVLPDGLVDSGGSPYWNATDTCCDYDGTGVDDVAYLTGLLDELAARYRVRGVGLVGHSAGGFMAYRLACEIPERLGALVSIAGSGFVDEADCRVTDGPLSILQVHGSDDDVMPFEGDDEAPGALEMLARWGARDGCAAHTWVLEQSRKPYAEEGDTTIGRYTAACDSGADVRLWRLDGSDHYPTFTARFTDDALDWLLERL